MKSRKVTILDYGVGNLYSVNRAFEVCGATDICITRDADEIRNAERLVLPGVGAFADGMRGLKDGGLDQAVSEFANSGRPLLGICLGMQMLATTSEEFGQHNGLNLIPGIIIPIASKNLDCNNLKIPVIGWSHLDCQSNVHFEGSILEPLIRKQAVYFIHSFQFIPDNQDNLLGSYQYGVHNITGAVGKDNIIGLQFHPEKSGKVGLNILSNFLKC
jgi:glutamine amidotransferase